MTLPLARPQVLDLEFLGLRHAIAAFVVRGPAGWVLVESGPMTTLPRLLEALAPLGVTPSEVTDLLVTHVHLDHAGAAGWWAAQGARVHVHAVGAPHLVDPSRLMVSAGRVYGSELDRLWGSMPAVAGEQLVVHAQSGPFKAGGLDWEALDTPGHARHHLCYRLGREVFTGDVGGIRLPGCLAAVAPTPPPDIDVTAWKASLAVLRSALPERLYLTHFGAVDDPGPHLDRVAAHLDAAVEELRGQLASGKARDDRVEAFKAWQRQKLGREGIQGEALAAYLAGNPSGMAVDGISRALAREAASSLG